MKALKKVTPNTKDYTYSGNILINTIPKPTAKFFQFLNSDIFNTDLSDFEFRLLLSLSAMKNETKFNNEATAKKFKKDVKTINRTLESLIKKEYIHISFDKQLIIRKLGKNDIPKPINTINSLIIKYVQRIDE